MIRSFRPIIFFLLIVPGIILSPFALTVRYLRSMGQTADSIGALKNPAALTFGTDGYLYVTDAGKNSILKYSLEGRCLGESGGAGSGEGRFDSPGGITTRLGFGLFVCDTRNNRIIQMKEDLSVISLFNVDGRTQDGLFSPSAITASREGTLFVADPNDGDLLKITLENRADPLWPSGNVRPGAGFTPCAAAIIHRLYLADAGSKSIRTFDRFGAFLGRFGEGRVIAPFGLASWNDSLLLASDQLTSQIIIFSESGVPRDSFAVFDASGSFVPGAVAAKGGYFAILKQRPPAVVLLRIAP